MRARVKFIYLSVCVLTMAGSCACTRQRPASWSYDAQAGVVAVAADKACLTIAATLPPSTAIRVIDPGAQRERTARIAAPDDRCAANATDAGVRGYTIRFEGDAPPTPTFGIAIVGAPRPRQAD